MALTGVVKKYNSDKASGEFVGKKLSNKVRRGGLTWVFSAK